MPPHRIADLIFTGIESGEHVGYAGRSAEVYDVDFDDERRRVAVSISDNGFIVTAYPIDIDNQRKVRPHKHRRKPS